MSHELRTPLNGVLATAQLLAASRLDDRQRELVALVESSGRVLTQLLSDVLDLARIEAGRLELSTERFDPGAVVREAIELWRAAAAAKDLSLLAEIAPDAEPAVLGDPLRLRQVLNNLLSNALKFTAEGGVAVRLDRDPVQPGVLRLTVMDTGMGFEPEQADALFNRFAQADGSIVRRFGGSGLGLSICRELAERMGGTITARGRPGEGASFQLRLPASVAEAAPPSSVVALEGPPAAVEAQPMRVLLAEDHPVNRRVVSLILEQSGVALTAVEDGALALEAFAAEPFDAVLMDMQMPVMDGLTATRAIRDLERAEGWEPTPIIMLTANVLPEHVGAALAAGANRHLGKPVSPQALIAALMAEQPLAAAA
jgi:CheY-like chemotaxis protein